MPTYTFKNRETNEENTEYLSISERDAYVRQHPELEQLPPTSVNISDPILIGRVKPGGAFRERLTDIKKAHHGSVVNTF